MSPITTIVSDFGGVLTTPLEGAFNGFAETTGITLLELGAALHAIETDLGANPIFELEVGRLPEAEFVARLDAKLSEQLGRPSAITGFGETFFAHLHPNDPMIELMQGLRDRGYRMGLLTNNVREWEPLWRPMLPIDEIFEVVVDSAFVGLRKPAPEIYTLTLDRLEVEPASVLFIDDMDVNCVAARELGMHAVQFVDNEQALTEIEAALMDRSDGLEAPR